MKTKEDERGNPCFTSGVFDRITITGSCNSKNDDEAFGRFQVLIFLKRDAII